MLSELIIESDPIQMLYVTFGKFSFVAPFSFLSVMLSPYLSLYMYIYGCCLRECRARLGWCVWCSARLSYGGALTCCTPPARDTGHPLPCHHLNGDMGGNGLESGGNAENGRERGGALYLGLHSLFDGL